MSTTEAGPRGVDRGLSGAARALSIAVVLLSTFIASLDLLIVNIAFPDIKVSFPESSLSDLSWVLSAYAITFAALLVPAGRWADRSGRKRSFMIGLILFTAASAACAAAPSVEMLVASRVLQAVGAALMTPSSFGLLLPLFPPGKRGVAVGLWSATSGAAAAAGPPIGGLLVQADWRWVFLVNVPLGIFMVLVGWRVLREIREEATSAPDILGAIVLAATVGVVVAAIVQGQDWGWTSARILGLLAAGALGLAFTIWRAWHHPAPVIEPAILRVPGVAWANLAGMLFFGGFGAMVLCLTLFLTGVWHHSILRAGMEIAPGPLTSAVAAVPAGLLAARYGTRVVGLAGGLIFAAGNVWWEMATTANPTYVSSFLLPAIVSGLGIGVILPCLSASATLPLPPERFATGTAMATMNRQVGFALGIAVVAAILGSHPDLDSFHTTWLFVAGCGLAAGLPFLAISRANPEHEGKHHAPAHATDSELMRPVSGRER